MNSDLANTKCPATSKDSSSLSKTKQVELLKQLDNWQIIDSHHLSKNYSFKNFATALQWVNKIGNTAEEFGHHPDLSFGWGYVEVKIWTHVIDDLTMADFILAAKIDDLS